MLRVVLFLLVVAAAAFGLHWLSDTRGTLTLDWQGYVVETSIFRAVVLLALFTALSVLAWSILQYIWRSPAAVGELFVRRREQRGLSALSTGLIAIGAGDKAAATRAALQARKSLPNEPLTHLLRAQTAQLSGDSTTARRIFEAMLASPDTEQLGLRGLFLEAERVGEGEAARQFAERAVRLNPKADWAVDALFDLQTKARDWSGALDTLAQAKRHGHIDKKLADRRRAVLLTAQAQMLEDDNAEQALTLATEAHGLAPDLVPAAGIAARILASRGQTPKAARIVQRTWKSSPHPELAIAYAHARTGDSTTDRLERVRQLLKLNPASSEGQLALAESAIEGREWTLARQALEPLLDDRLTQRVATLMARIEGEQHGNAGKVREWLARAVHAPRDPAWTADGVVSDRWAPVSPVTGRLDAFEWRVPVESAEQPDALLLKARIDELVQLGATGSETSLPRPSDTTAGADGAKRGAERSDVEDAIEVTIRTGKSAQRPNNSPAKSSHPTAEDYLVDGDDSLWTSANATATDRKGNTANAALAAEAASPHKPHKIDGESPTNPAHRAPDDPGPRRPDTATANNGQTDRTRASGAKR
jgi:HemY protein